MVYPQCAAHGSGGAGGNAQSSDLFVLTGRYAHALPDIFGDVNGDGHVDLVALTSSSASVWLGCGDGTFSTSPITSNIPSVPTFWGDFSGDGRMDLVYQSPFTRVPGMTATNQNLILGQPDGTFVVSQDQFGDPVGGDRNAYLVSPVSGDINGDGRLDLLYAGWFPTSTGSIATGNSVMVYAVLGKTPDIDSNFNVVATLPGWALGHLGTVDEVELADVDSDGHADALVTFHTQTSLTDRMDHQWILRGKGDGSFGPQTAATLPFGRFKWGQLDGDGKIDALQVNVLGNPQIYWNEGGGTFSAGPLAPSSFFGDFDGDGQADFLFSESVGGVTAPGMISFGDGARGFGRSLTTPAIDLEIIGDVNGDGVSDLLSWDSTAGTISIYVSTAKHPPIGPPDINCTPLPADQCTGPTSF